MSRFTRLHASGMAPQLQTPSPPASSSSSSSHSASSSSSSYHLPPSTSQHQHQQQDRQQQPPSKRPRPWIDPSSLPTYGSIAHIDGNATPYIKHLTQNTFFSYGVGVGAGMDEEEYFAYKVGVEVRLVEVSVFGGGMGEERMEARTVAEVVVGKGMLNGAGMLHGGCLAYLIDNCCSTPLVVLGLVQGVNGVGVTQAMNILFHSPAARYVFVVSIVTSAPF
ncbi:hypothetical protein ONZ45_g19174 [Pleurotus djamor]|nr:hypothetical protein ONZ45_g19174 [Pleurotus djamor]